MNARALSVRARDGRKTTQPPSDGGVPLSFIAWGGVALAAMIVALSLLLATAAHAQPAEVWFELFSADRGDRVTVMQGKVRMGPFPEVICYAVGALTIESLNTKYPNKDFMGRCDGGVLLTMREIADRALAMLPQESQTKEKNR
jgi:hypothetical protein